MTNESTERVTLAEIATEVGVSLSTISKVLNGRPDVSAPTRTKVEATLAEPRVPASQDGAVRESPHRARLPRARGGLVDGDHPRRRECRDRARHERRAHRERQPARARRPSGSRASCVAARSASCSCSPTCRPSTARVLRSRAIPFVIIDPAGDPSPDVPSIGSANWSGGLMATRHLIELGHTQIAAITGPGRHDVLARAHRRLPLGDELGGPRRSTRTGSASATSTPRAASCTAASCSTVTTARPPSSRAATCRRSACSRRCAGSACGCPKTCRWSATTTSRWPSG